MKATPQRNDSGLTFVELLVTLVVGAGLITVAAIGFATVAGAPTRGGRIDVDIGSANHATLYGAATNYITIGQNPNYFQSSQARRMKDRLMSEVGAASAVFVLGRNQVGGGRPSSIPVTSGIDFRTNTTPSAFRNFLVGAIPSLASVYPAAQSGALTNSNVSIFILRGLNSITTSANTLNVISVYEVDILPASSPSGTFASVRRYGTNATVPTDYYHVFYLDDANTNNPFRPLAAFFGRTTTTNTPVAFNVAPNSPFSFVWWPDPLVSFLSGRPGATNATAGTAREQYDNMAEKTSLFFVLPTFPGQ
jgi:hypothetical protein